jgi:hypothetical protein
MAETFTPTEAIEIYCRFCKKLGPAQLDRSIAANGKTVDRGSTFEYYCSKCLHTFCFSGADLAEKSAVAAALADPKQKPKPREYDPKRTYIIGEVVFHKKFKEEGRIIGKQQSQPSLILVSFRKAGVKRLVEGA